MNGLSAALMARRSVPFELAFGLVAVGVATGLRFVLDDVLPAGFPFVTFFPAVMLSLVFASIRCGIVVALVCGTIAWYWFIAPFGTFGLNSGGWLALGFYALITTTDVLFISAAVWALQELSLAREKAHAVAQSRSLMFSELQHRVSNNLATIAALLRLQTSQTKDIGARRALSASQARITSISRLQRRLHSVDVQSVDAGEYLREVLQDTVEVAKETAPVALTFNAAPLRILNDAAVPLGLIASELMMNSMEHGAARDGKAVVDVRLSVDPADEAGQIPATLEIRDNGPGLPEGFDLDASDSLGLTVARQFAKALDGELTLTLAAGGGTLARLRFSVPSPEHIAATQVPDTQDDVAGQDMIQRIA
ncbi:sensor histidine kinase [Roseinatronobacter sp. S2]|uniref:sensor histidine kinase n=1 Tax=Roseinatronobacter sp. S2 TaxID=3035471 RepID=UPI0024104A8F|nr:histidine kinase dimerization/phosphoacceptor domain -containing protein [Roseinatronobacter sp. S2]WFE76806.1 histidine kinase dimerization/phosphoacceptor domain -containing protein [Roseinatronobacter sp. S2]